MMPGKGGVAGLLAFALTACAAAPASAPTAADDVVAGLPAPRDDTCGAGMYASLIGGKIDGPGVPGPSRLYRHILPGGQVTMDYIAQRMNIEADAQGVIRKISCG